MTRALLLLLLAACGCSGRDEITSCASDLRGTYLAGSARWMIIEIGRGAFEAYPLFDDTLPGPLEVAPRVIDLERDPDGKVAGTVHRRFMQNRQVCDSTHAVRVTACVNDTLELVMADPVAPIGFDPCGWGRPPDSRVERWRHE